MLGWILNLEGSPSPLLSNLPVCVSPRNKECLLTSLLYTKWLNKLTLCSALSLSVTLRRTNDPVVFARASPTIVPHVNSRGGKVACCLCIVEPWTIPRIIAGIYLKSLSLLSVDKLGWRCHIRLNYDRYRTFAAAHFCPFSQCLRAGNHCTVMPSNLSNQCLHQVRN